MPCARARAPAPRPLTHGRPPRPNTQVLVRKKVLHEMLELHRRVSPKEILVGWYSTWTGAKLGASATAKRGADDIGAQPTDEFAVAVNDFFKEASLLSGKEVSPVHLLVDVSLHREAVRITANKMIENSLLKKCERARAPRRA